MRNKELKLFSSALFLTLAITTFISGGQAQKAKGDKPLVIPKAWDDQQLTSLEVPLAEASASPVHVPAEYYYRIPTRVIYKTYPVYAPGKEPPGYMEWLQQQEPAIVFDASKLTTEADWIKAGELVFDAPIAFDALNKVADVRDPAWYERTGMPVAKDGTMPFNRYVIRKKGKVELGEFSCATCHTRVMPDGIVIKGAQGNYPLGRLDALDLKARASAAKDEKTFIERFRFSSRRAYGTPWLQPDPQAELDKMSIEDIVSANEAIQPGVQARVGTSLIYPVQVPDLIGIKDRRYLDRTGHVRNRDIGDLMRYSALNQGAFFLDRFGDFIPIGKLPAPAVLQRYSDEQLYALVLYLYSLKPPPNPNKFDALAARGQKIFKREGCAGCHTPPLYTNNKLTPVEGFKVPEDHYKKYDVMSTSLGTDSGLALKTRRGTGYYKVPSLKGVWYRGPFGHSGFVSTLEDWIDPRRLRDDYVPTGFRGYARKSGAVKGHRFGLDLSAEDRKALIAFLKTL